MSDVYTISDIDMYQEVVIVSKKQIPSPVWLTLNEAAKRPECPVTGETLRQMIKRGDVPKDCYQERPFGKSRKIHYIDANCLRGLDYRETGQRGKEKPKD